MARMAPPDDCVLVRTADGTRKMRSHASDITPKLRSVLFLIDGVQSTLKILARAGDLRPLLESQLTELHRLGLVEAIDGKDSSVRPCVRSMSGAITPAGISESKSIIPAIVCARMQLLRLLERLHGHELQQYSAPLLEARSWRELATGAKDLSRTLHDVVGAEAALDFWTSAKKILTTWRGKEISLNRP